MGESEQESVLTAFQLRPSANFQGRGWCSRRPLWNEIGEICDTAEMVCEDLNGRWA